MTMMKMLQISTAHVTEETMNAIRADTDPLIPSGSVGLYGAVIWVPPDVAEDAVGYDEWPKDLVACLDYARSQGADYLMLDSYANSVEALPIFDW